MTQSTARIRKYASLVNQIVKLAPEHAERSTAALALFPVLSDEDADVRIARAEATLAKLVEVPDYVIHPGIYTVPTVSGHRTFRVEVQPKDADFAPGQMILSYLTGRDNTSDYKGIAFVTVDGAIRPWSRFRGSEIIEIAQTLSRDPQSVLTAKHCVRCNRVLTTPESVAAGIGPECSKKGLA